MGSTGDEVGKEVHAEPDLEEAATREDGSVDKLGEPHVRESEDAARETLEQTFPETTGVDEKVDDGGVAADEPGAVGDDAAVVVEKVDDGAVTAGEPGAVGDDAAVVVEKADDGAVTAGEPGAVFEEATPAPKRKLPSVKRFSARRSAGIDDGNAGPDAKAPSAIRKQRASARMGIDDRDTVDYTTDDPPKPRPKPVEEEAAVAKEADSGARPKTVLSVAEREQLRLRNMTRNKEIVCLERLRGRIANITEGLELHTEVFSRVEQQKLVDLVRELQAKGRRNELKDRTYSEPRKWMRGKGRVTLQFGCCYNYAVDKHGNVPGILRDEAVDPIPPLLRTTIKRLVRWHVMPPTCVPDSCIINIYEEGDCIPPHIDHHDFLRPFCTLSLLSECNIVFGANLEVVGPGEFGGALSLPLPMGSVLVLNGNAADVAKHAVPAVPTERISITFRKMDPAKVPRGFTIDDELQRLRPVALP